MKLMELLKAGYIQYAYGYVFSETQQPGLFIGISDESELEGECLKRRQSYTGSEFFSLEDELPARIFENGSEFCWAEAVKCGDWFSHETGNPPPRLIGAIVTWSTPEKEWQTANQPVVLSFDDFNASRHG